MDQFIVCLKKQGFQVFTHVGDEISEYTLNGDFELPYSELDNLGHILRDGENVSDLRSFAFEIADMSGDVSHQVLLQKVLYPYGEYRLIDPWQPLATYFVKAGLISMVNGVAITAADLVRAALAPVSVANANRQSQEQQIAALNQQFQAQLAKVQGEKETMQKSLEAQIASLKKQVDSLQAVKVAEVKKKQTLEELRKNRQIIKLKFNTGGGLSPLFNLGLGGSNDNRVYLFDCALGYGYERANFKWLVAKGQKVEIYSRLYKVDREEESTDKAIYAQMNGVVHIAVSEQEMKNYAEGDTIGLIADPNDDAEDIKKFLDEQLKRDRIARNKAKSEGRLWGNGGVVHD